MSSTDEAQEYTRNVYAAALTEYVNEDLSLVLDADKLTRLKRHIREAMRQEYNAGYHQASSEDRWY